MSNEKVVNTKVVELINIYKSYLGHYSIWQSLNNPNFEFQKIASGIKFLEHQMMSNGEVMNTKYS